MTDVFISYSRKDKAFVQTLHDALKAHDRNTWVDWEGIPLTADWWQEIERGIEGADTFVFVISPDSISSKVCREEIDHAVKHNKRLVPIVHREGFEMPLVHEALSKHNWLFFREQDDFEAAFQSLMTAIDTDLEHVRAHTRLLERAIEWDTKNRNESFALRGDDLTDAEQWLAQGTSKEPRPTELQGEYIGTSRRIETARQKADSRKQQLFISGICIFALLAAGAAVLAFQQRSEAKHQAELARKSEGQAKQQTILAEKRLSETLEAKKVADQKTTDAKAAQRKAEAARKAEAEQKQKAVMAQKLAEQQKAEAQKQTRFAIEQKTIADKQTALAKEQTLLAREQTQQVEKGKFNAEMVAQSLTVESALASDPRLEPVVEALEMGQKLRQRIQDVEPDVLMRTVLTLQQAVYDTKWRERNRIDKLLSGRILNISFSPDGQLIAAPFEYGIQLWKSDGEEFKQVKGFVTFDIDFAKDNQTFVTADFNKTATLRNLIGKTLQVFPHDALVSRVRFSPDGKTIASISENKIVLWTLDGRLLKTLEGHSAEVTDISFSPDGTIASASEDKTIKLWDSNGKLLKTLEGHKGAVASVQFSPDGKTIISSGDSTVRLWSNAGQLIKTLEHGEPVYGAKFSPDGKWIASGYGDKKIKIWSLDGQEIKTLEGKITRSDSSSLAASFSPDGKTLATARDASVNLWDLVGREPKKLRGHKDFVNSVKFSPNGKVIATVSNDKTVKLWNLNGEEIATLDKFNESIDKVEFSPDSQAIVTETGSPNYLVQLWHLDGRQIMLLKGEGAKFSPDGQKIATTIDRNKVRLWSLNGGISVDLEGSNPKFSSDGQTIATSINGKMVKIWTLNGQNISTLQTDKLSIKLDGTTNTNCKEITLMRLDFSKQSFITDLDEIHPYCYKTIGLLQDGKAVAIQRGDTLDPNYRVELWNLDGSKRAVLKGQWASFSRDGTTVATSDSGTVRVWSLSGTELKTLKGFRPSFSPDGKTLAATNADGTVTLYNLNLDSLMKEGCDWLHDYLQNNPYAKEEDQRMCGITAKQKQANATSWYQQGFLGWMMQWIRKG